MQTNHSQAAELRGRAVKALDGEHPRHDWPINNGPEVATAHAALAAAAELADVTDRLIAIDVDLARIAEAAEERNRAAERVPDYTEAELLVVRGEISRTDNKSSILLASVAIVVGPVTGQISTLLKQPWPIAALGLVASVLAGVATWLLLNVVLPHLSTRTTGNFIHYARCSASELNTALGPDADRRGELAALSAIAETKFRNLGRAGLLLKVSGLLLAATAGLAIAF
ncbi:Pycsar system effector family protein [Streptomyces sp. NPDC056084]|uniref:Pycsar system effector family protein n=1 Tax=unclassified Streptomyces TaxID=2593676 RepID=UPI0035E2CEA3